MQQDKRPRLNSPDPIIVDGKVLFKNEWDRIRKSYFGGMERSSEIVDPLERLDRMERKKKINYAR